VSSRQRNGHVSHERWLVSYADFITLLFSFFVVLYAFAKADQKKQTEVKAAVDTAFRSLGIFGQVTPKPGKAASTSGQDQPVIPMNIVMGEEVMSPARVKDDLEKIQRDLEQRLSNQVAQHTVSIEMGRDGLVISLREAGFFDSGSANPRPETLPALRQIAAALGHSPYDVRVEGHTDNIPMHSVEFDSNWELSSARATRIARLLLELKAVSADRLSAAGYAEFHPVASDATPEGRAKNRRVDLVVLPRARIDFSAQERSQTPPGWHKIGDQ
jgi:chemotaxis protein MotB